MTFRPFFAPREDELTQGYFARTGRLHALADVNSFLRYTELAPEELRIGSDACVDRVADLSGADRTLLARNVLRSHGNTKSRRDGTMSMNGEPLSARIVRRNVVKVCPACLLEDQLTDEPPGPGQWALRTHWLLRPVVVCPNHHIPLVAVATEGGVLAFDLARALMRAGFEPRRWRDEGVRRLPGPFQNYVINRMHGASAGSPWLDGQTLSQAVRACEMLGSLIADGPEADIAAYGDADWARVGDIGFGVAVEGSEAVLTELTRIRTNSGRTSGRAGPQAVFGKLYRSLTRSDRREEAGPICDTLREAIIRNFPVGPGDLVLGKPVVRRLVHSANSLMEKTQQNRQRHYKLLMKVGFIPECQDGIAANQHVFPAEAAEQALSRIRNSVTLKEVNRVLGCTRTNAAQLAAAGVVTSIVPMDEMQGVGLTVGTFAVDDLRHLLDAVCDRARPVEQLPDGYVDFPGACRRASCVALVSWQRGGDLHRTVRVGREQRLDQLWFDPGELRRLVVASRRDKPVTLSAMARKLHVDRDTLLWLASDAAQLLHLAPSEGNTGDRGRLCVTAEEFCRFQSTFVTLAGLAGERGVAKLDLARRLSAHGVRSVGYPDRPMIQIFRRRDVEGLP